MWICFGINELFMKVENSLLVQVLPIESSASRTPVGIRGNQERMPNVLRRSYRRLHRASPPPPYWCEAPPTGSNDYWTSDFSISSHSTWDQQLSHSCTGSHAGPTCYGTQFPTSLPYFISRIMPMHMHMRACTCACACTCTSTCARAHACVRARAHVCACACECAFACVCVLIYLIINEHYDTAVFPCGWSNFVISSLNLLLNYAVQAKWN